MPGLSGNTDFYPTACGIGRFYLLDREILLSQPKQLRDTHHVGVNGHCHLSPSGCSNEVLGRRRKVAGECLSLQLVIFGPKSLLPWQLEGRATEKPGLRLFLSESKDGRGNKI